MFPEEFHSHFRNFSVGKKIAEKKGTIHDQQWFYSPVVPGSRSLRDLGGAGSRSLRDPGSRGRELPRGRGVRSAGAEPDRGRGGRNQSVPTHKLMCREVTF